MNVTYRADYDLADAAAHTGKSLEAWFAIFDQRDGTKAGRRPLADFLMKEMKLDLWWATTAYVEYERARNLRKKDGSLAGYNICITKTIKASAPQLYEAFTDPELLGQWFATHTKQDLTVGGRFENSDGNMGSYKKLQPGKGLAFTWEGQGQEQNSVVDVKLEAKGDNKSGLIITHDRIANRAEADGLRQGWGEAVERLKQFLEH
ncbi:MAG: SRPBCC domain-containing protein [Chloroflexi bacterium]|nr:SRPBCC domain-containing protein [Chloroflexota bacterium]